jgi:ribosomal protein S10
MFNIVMTCQLLSNLAMTVSGPKFLPDRVKYVETFVKKFGGTKNSWEFYYNTVFRLYSTVRVQFCHQFCPEILRS